MHHARAARGQNQPNRWMVHECSRQFKSRLIDPADDVLRRACVDCGFCSVGCPIDAKGSTAVTVIRDALLTGNLTLLSETCVTQVLTSADGLHATGVTVIGPDGTAQTLTADNIILAANAIALPHWPAPVSVVSFLIPNCLLYQACATAVLGL